ncbi:MAG: AAA family ATPase [Candidatus Cryptobacteroides sp.]
MKILQLHIRNIASVEKADIDFENGLGGAASHNPPSIFLITGDTGSGKSVILDGIALALYGTTPRIQNVLNSKDNKFSPSADETISVNDIRQYTRIGITPGADCYSEVVFEGNDGLVYRSRLSLGMKKSARGKNAGRVSYSTPVMEIETGSRIYTRITEVKEIAQRAVGLTFEQFCRMAMLAQGQFAAFLTGDKKSREIILEQLTNTEMFSQWGEAVSRIYKRAEEAEKNAKALYEADVEHTIPEQELGALQDEKSLLTEKCSQLDKIKSEKGRILSALEMIENERNKIQLSELRLKEAGEERESIGYLSASSLVKNWNETATVRVHLGNRLNSGKELVLNRQEEAEAARDFRVLLADLEARREEQANLHKQAGQLQELLDKDSAFAPVFAKAGEIAAMAVQYSALLKEQETEIMNLRDAGAETAALSERRTLSETALKKVISEQVQVREKIHSLNEERNGLDPDGISRKLVESAGRHSVLKKLDSDVKSRKLKQREYDALSKSVNEAQAGLAVLSANLETARADYNASKNEFIDAQSLAETMRAGVNEALVELRRKLVKDNAEFCPLCGQRIGHICQDVDFEGILSPLEIKCQAARQKYENAENVFTAMKSGLDSKKAALAAGRERLGALAEELKALDDSIANSACESGLDCSGNLEERICDAFESLKKQNESLTKDRDRAESIFKEIRQWQEKLNSLDYEFKEANKLYNNAEQALRDNASRIRQHEDNSKSIGLKINDLHKSIPESAALFRKDWDMNPGLFARDLNTAADIYKSNVEKLKNIRMSINGMSFLLESISASKRAVLAERPSWDFKVQPEKIPDRNIADEWASFSRRLSSISQNMKTCIAQYAESDAIVKAYCDKNGITEEELMKIDASGDEFSKALEYTTSVDGMIKSLEETIRRSARDISSSISALGLENDSQLPERQEIESEIEKIDAGLLEAHKRIGEIEGRLESNRQNVEQVAIRKTEYEAALTKAGKWRRIAGYFGGTRFRTLAQTYILRPLLNNANVYLDKITDRYTLTCSEENEQLSILVLDRYNRNQVRSATVLSGGERFMISLALSLALSSLNRPDMNVNILFIDEGFGTLDEKSLDSVMATLERLQEIAGQNGRRVGIISHREELEERIPVKIKVIKKGPGRSIVECEHN